MLHEKDGMDKHMLFDKNTKKQVDRKDLTFTLEDKMIYRQYECASDEIAALSKFFQDGGPTSHEQLFEQRYVIQEVSKPQFIMYSDISHITTGDLGKRIKSEVVLQNDAVDQHDVTMGKPQTMLECIENFRVLFAEDFSFRSGLTYSVLEEDNKNYIYDTLALPPEVAIAALLNPLFGGKLLLSDVICFCFINNQCFVFIIDMF